MKYLALVLLAGTLAGCASQEKLPAPPTVAEIVQMAKTGQSADAIIQRIAESRGIYQMPASQLARLSEQGVPDKVIDYMQQTYIDAVRYEEWRRAGDAYFYSPYSPLLPPFRRYPYGWW
ncbi:MAG TPA: hypothetical protein VKF40_15950 [Burkholderiales bacterium]|nr:hypothetical protein [Burkholderiales bacterium]